MLYISCLGIAKHIESIGLCLAKFVKFLSIIFSNFLPHSFSSLRTLTPQISEFLVLCSRSLMILQLFSLYCSYLIFLLKFDVFKIIYLQFEFDMSSNSLTPLSFLFCFWTHQVNVYILLIIFFSSKISS